MTQNDNKDMQALDALLEDAADRTVDVPDSLTARVLTDARSAMPGTTAVMSKQDSMWDRVVSLFGGWPAMSGLAAATCAGFWIGVSDPAGLSQAAYSVLGVETALLSAEAAELSGFGWDLDEGL